jgi:TRAP-type C4-dicarboxylate transport system, small permease component
MPGTDALRAAPLVRLSERLAALITVIAGAALVLATLHMFADAILTRFFRRPIPGTLEIVTQYYMVALFFLPLAHAEAKGAHISADLLFGRLSPAVQRWLGIANLALLTAFGGVFLWQAVVKAIRQTGRGDLTRLGDLTIWLWPSRWIVVLGLAALVMVAAVRLVEAVVPGGRADE